MELHFSLISFHFIKQMTRILLSTSQSEILFNMTILKSQNLHIIITTIITSMRKFIGKISFMGNTRFGIYVNFSVRLNFGDTKLFYMFIDIMVMIIGFFNQGMGSISTMFTINRFEGS